MPKRAYRVASVVKSGKTNSNDEGSNRSSRRVLSRSELDKIAAKDKFPVFIKELGLGRSLYTNKRESFKRVYDEYGRVVVTYTPKCSLQSSLEFHNPVQILPLNFQLAHLNQYTGTGRRLGQ